MTPLAQALIGAAAEAICEDVHNRYNPSGGDGFVSDPEDWADAARVSVLAVLDTLVQYNDDGDNADPDFDHLGTPELEGLADDIRGGQ